MSRKAKTKPRFVHGKQIEFRISNLVIYCYYLLSYFIRRRFSVHKKKILFPCGYPQSRASPILPCPPLLSAVKEFHVTNNKNNNIDDCMWSCGSWAWTAPHESYQNNLKAQSVDNTEKNWVCYSLSLISVVSFLSRIANSFLIYTHSQPGRHSSLSQRGLRSIVFARSPLGWLR